MQQAFAIFICKLSAKITSENWLKIFINDIVVYFPFNIVLRFTFSFISLFLKFVSMLLCCWNREKKTLFQMTSTKLSDWNFIFVFSWTAIAMFANWMNVWILNSVSDVLWMLIPNLDTFFNMLKLQSTYSLTVNV